MTSIFDRDRWTALRTTFDELIELDAATRAERLDAIGTSDPDTRRALEELLGADAAVATRLAHVDAVFGTAEHAAVDPSDDVLGLAGQTVAQFRIGEPFGVGGMAVIYRAEDTRLGRTVALKFPLPHQRLDRHIRERFLREARAAGALDHPNLCSVYEAGETSDGQLFLAMPLYDGETLKTRLAREGRLPIADAVEIAVQIAHGLGAAHRSGIVHRDLKPANVMLLPDGGVKILDFGLARVADEMLTASRVTVGTAPYMAPEQVRGESLDSRTDLWALGVLLHEMLTGRRPFEGQHDVAIAHGIVHIEPTRPSALRTELGTDTDALVQRLLCKRPAGRYASADDVAADLAVLQPRRSARRRMPHIGRFIPLRRRAAAVTASLAVGLTVLAFSTWVLRDDAGHPPEPRIVVVLPFEDLNQRDTADYLAAGLTDAVATQLARLRDLAVPSEQSRSEYDAAGKSLTQIAQELEAVAIISGSVDRSADGVRLEIELFDAGRGRQIWKRSYTGTLATMLELQRDATKAIVAALRVELTARERALLARLPTAHAAAYALYLQGRDIELRSASANVAHESVEGLQRRDVELRSASANVARESVEGLQRAQSFYAGACELDPEFALARARLAMSHIQLAWRYDRTRARRDQARLEAEAALRVQPGLPEAHEVLAHYWNQEGEPVNAVREFENALAGFPNSSSLHLGSGFSLRRAARWPEAVAALERAIQLDPANRTAHQQAALTFSRMRLYLKAIQHWDRVIALSPPGNPVPERIRGHQFLRLTGKVDSLEAALTRIPAERDEDGMMTWTRYNVLRIRRQSAAALVMLDGAGHAISRDGIIYRPVTLLRARVLKDLGDHKRARSNYEAARVLLEDSVTAHPEDPSIRVALGLAYAGLSRKADALREANAAMDLVPLAEDNPAATGIMGAAVEVFADLGENDEALRLLELLLSMNAGREVSVPLLRVDPIVDPLRTDPRFDRMLTRFSRD